MTIQLASKSPRRAELLAQIGVPYKVVDIDIPEVHEVGETPEDYVARLAREKALAGLAASPGLPTLGADTIVVKGEHILEKPHDMEDCCAMLSQLSDSEHKVMTAVTICQNQKIHQALSVTRVVFNAISRAQAERYWATGEPVDKAGSYAIQGYGAVFVKRIEGSFSGVVGLPLEVTCNLLQHFNIDVWNDD